MSHMPDEGGPEKQWQAFTDYQAVSHETYQTVVKALNEYAFITSLHAHDKRPTAKNAVTSRTRILHAANILELHIKENKETEPFEAIWERWDGEDGHLTRFQGLNLRDECPPWLDQFVDDIKTAAWHSGYLKVGRKEPADPEDDEAQVLEVIQ